MSKSPETIIAINKSSKDNLLKFNFDSTNLVIIKNQEKFNDFLGEKTLTLNFSKDNNLEFNYYPIDLAITDTNTQKVIENVFLQTEFNNNFKSIKKSSNITPTLKISKDNNLEFNYHPIDLAITDTNTQKVIKNGEITLKIIDKSQCL